MRRGWCAGLDSHGAGMRIGVAAVAKIGLTYCRLRDFITATLGLYRQMRQLSVNSSVLSLDSEIRFQAVACRRGSRDSTQDLAR